MIKPKTTWRDTNHYIKLIKDPWYKVIVEIDNLINLYTPQFYQKKSIKTLHLMLLNILFSAVLSVRLTPAGSCV